MRLGSLVSVTVGCWLVGCVDTRMPPVQSKSPTDAGFWSWDAARGSDKPQVAYPPATSSTAVTPQARNSARSGRLDGGRVVPPVAAHVSPDRGADDPTPTGSGNDPAVHATDAGMHTVAEVAAMPSRPGDMVITELMIDPKTLPDTQGEWFELYNATAQELSLRDCKVDDGAKHARPINQSLRVAPRAYVTVARSTHPGFTPDATVALSLSNSADSLALVCGGVEIDRVTYDSKAGFIVKPGVSLALDPSRLDAHDNDVPSAWCEGRGRYAGDFGTPGRANPPCDVDDVDAGSPPLEG